MSARTIADYLRFGFAVEFCPRCRWFRAISPLLEQRILETLGLKCEKCGASLDIVINEGSRPAAAQ